MIDFFKELKFPTLVDLLRFRALHQPNKTAFTFLVDGEIESSSLTYQELNRQAQVIAAQLQSEGLNGKTALLLYPPGLEFIAAFFGCLYAGVVAIPAYPPRPNQSLSRLQAVAADAQAAIALTTTTVLSKIERQFTQYPNLTDLRKLATDNIIASDLAQAWEEPALNSDTQAFLQYTSGSTGKPKGVVVSHGNLLHNQLLIQQAMQHTEKTIFVGWLPLFHDMGLIGNMLQPICLGVPCILMSPVAFLQRPLRWLQAISRYKATTSGGPNFAYELCVSKITNEQRDNLDLSSWEVAFNGAEPVRAETLNRFATAFSQCGFRREAFYPCYGLAEATLIVSGGLKTALPVLQTLQSDALKQNRVFLARNDKDPAHTLIGCGQTLLNQQIVIIHPETLTRCQFDEVGEIWVSGPSVAKGYWKRVEDTLTTFQAYLADTGEGPFLRTGDLGFLKEGELFVTGRLKDLIIIRGRNHYPQDIELTVEQSNSALRPNYSAAFSVDVNGEERLVVACELERQYLRNLDLEMLVGNIRQAISEQHELEVYAILLLKTGSIPKTSSGKIQRHACRASFLTGSLDVVRDWTMNPESKVEFQYLLKEVESLRQQLKTPQKQQSGFSTKNALKQESSENDFHKAQLIQAWLMSKIAKRLQVNPSSINVQQPFTSFGLDSVEIVNFSSQLEDLLGSRLSPTLLYDYPTIEVLSQHLESIKRSDLLAKIEEYSDEEVDSLLYKLLN